MRIKDFLWGYPKDPVFNKILNKYKVRSSQVCFVGDDLIDIPIARRVGLSVAVADAASELKAIVDVVTRNQGGRGAVREVVELIMKSQGLWLW